MTDELMGKLANHQCLQIFIVYAMNIDCHPQPKWSILSTAKSKELTLLNFIHLYSSVWCDFSTAIGCQSHS